MLLVWATDAAASEGEADKPDGVDVIFGQTHSVKTIEDIHEVLVQTAPGINSASLFAKRPLLCWCVGAGPTRR